MQNRPHTTVVLAMSVDGKIADFRRSPARFGSLVDKIHLEKQIAASDAILFGAGTLRAYSTTMTITETILLQQRKKADKHPQPVHIVISRSGNLNPDIKFFQQPNSELSNWITPNLVSKQNNLMIEHQLGFIVRRWLLFEIGTFKEFGGTIHGFSTGGGIILPLKNHSIEFKANYC
jgi:riboflavin biosynthesis pyrimidine reductase